MGPTCSRLKPVRRCGRPFAARAGILAGVETRSAAKPKRIGQLTGQQSSSTHSQPFAVKPELAGPEEGACGVGFVLTAGRDEGQLSGLWIDPRMRR